MSGRCGFQSPQKLHTALDIEIEVPILGVSGFVPSGSG